MKGETIRSTVLPSDILGGTRLFCSFDSGWFLVRTRFEILKRSRDVYKALDFFESFALDGVS